MTTSTATIEANGANKWLIQVERHLKDESATGKVVVKQKSPPTPENPLHVELASGRAWLSLGETMLVQGNFEDAIACARSGLDELGQDYASPLVSDDTQMKLLAAEERIQEGHISDAASVMLRMLYIRTQLYAELHSSTISDNPDFD